ncbi:hypothetical protein EVAR_16949_1 [Eumeta japonica]|uniref:Uncharacterized protein n=1 Tax=Eumeta variegata TaxID=151549 RepID=A0A4C1TVU2_EUMVA|nr:hypothetical protein EVAR_16949_1 [Eumeta japonica]
MVASVVMLARNAALTKKTKADYNRYPLIHAKRVIRAVSLEEWQERYTEKSTGNIVKRRYSEILASLYSQHIMGLALKDTDQLS